MITSLSLLVLLPRRTMFKPDVLYIKTESLSFVFETYLTHRFFRLLSLLQSFYCFTINMIEINNNVQNERFLLRINFIIYVVT